MANQLVFDPTTDEFRNDPHTFWRRVRAQDPVHWAQAWGIWLVTTHRDVAALLRDNERVTARDPFFGGMEGATGGTGSADDEWTIATGTLPFMDPPDHTRLRRLVLRAFTPRVIERLRPQIAANIDRLLDDVEGKPEFDIIHDLSAPLPLMVICDLLGVPHPERPEVARLAVDAVGAIDPTVSVESLLRTGEAVAAMADYFQSLIARRLADPQDDLISQLLAVEEQGDALSRVEVIGTCVTLGTAGHETTMNLIGNGMLALLQQRAQWELLKARPDLARHAVEELLRYAGPIQMGAAPRTALVDFELHGKQIREGNVLRPVLASASRDPAVFRDPERLDITRTDNRHMALSHGIHFCLGAATARMETQLVLEHLIRRHPDLELAEESAEWKSDVVVRGLRRLPVRAVRAT